MTDKNQQLPGLNVYRALAVILMILAHAARVQTNMSSLHNQPALAGPLDWPFVGSLIIEPIISAMFLFIAGFSLVLSLQQTRETPAAWIIRLAKRMGTLYGISVLFALADQGVQWPGLLVSSGVLGIIAVGVLSTGSILISPRPWQALVGFTLIGIVITYFLDTRRISIIGLNAGAGGMLPLVVLAYLGAMAGLVFQRWKMNGLAVLLAISLVVGLLALIANAPWVTTPPSSMRHYPGDRLQSVLYSLQDVIGLYEGTPYNTVVRYWNHSWIFPLRALPVLVAGLVVFLGVIRELRNPLLGFLDWMGRQALNLYILHLILLAGIEVSGLRPETGWQTLLIVAAILAVSPWLLQRISFVPLQAGNLKNKKT